MYTQLMNTETPLQINEFMTIVMHYDGISLPLIIVNLEGGSAEPPETPLPMALLIHPNQNFLSS